MRPRVSLLSGTRLKPKGNGDSVVHVIVALDSVMSGTRLKPKGNGDR